MSLIKCPECGKEVSDQSETCIQCGCPLNTKQESKEEPKKEPKSKKKAGIIITIILLAAVIGVGLYFVLTKDSRAYAKADKLMEANNYSEASEIFLSLGEYDNAADKYNECIYQIALELLEDEQYKEAEQYFSDIKSYKDAAELYEECLYLQTVDGQFMRKMALGLQARWKENAENTEWDEAKRFNNFVNAELEHIGSFAGEAFENPELQRLYDEYIEALGNSLSAFDYYTMDYLKYSDLAQASYAARLMIIRELYENYNLKIDPEYEDTLKEVLGNASVVDEQRLLEAEVDEMVAQIEYELIEDSYGFKTYKVYMENTTSQTFEHFSLTVNLKNAEGTIIGTTYTGSTTNLTPGQKVEYDFMTDKEFVEVEFYPTYF